MAKAWYRRGEDWTKEYIDHTKPMFYSRDDYNDGFFDSRGVASAQQRDLVRQQRCCDRVVLHIQYYILVEKDIYKHLVLHTNDHSQRDQNQCCTVQHL